VPFHRVINDFMVAQGGDVELAHPERSTRYPSIKAEFHLGA